MNDELRHCGWCNGTCLGDCPSSQHDQTILGQRAAALVAAHRAEVESVVDVIALHIAEACGDTYDKPYWDSANQLIAKLNAAGFAVTRSLR